MTERLKGFISAAVAWAVAEKHTREGVPMVVLSTASPYKFPAAVLGALGEKTGDDEFAMMEQLHRSRPTIREALRMLEQGGYVASTHGASGAVVQELSLHAAEEPLKDMGITALFNVSTADLRGIGSAPSGNNLYVSSVLHKTYLSLDENGTKAAAEAYMYAACKYRNGMVVVARCRDIDLWEKRDGKWLVVKRTVAGDNTMILHPDFAPDYNNGRDKVKDPSYDYFETIE